MHTIIRRVVVPARLWQDRGGRDICFALSICQAGGLCDQHVVGGGHVGVGGGHHVVGGGDLNRCGI